MTMRNTFKNLMRKVCCFLLIAATVLACLPISMVSAADPSPVNKTATLAYTLKNLKYGNVVQNFHIGEEYIYISQTINSSTTYISRLIKNDTNKTATFDKGMSLTEAGIGESLDMFTHKNKVYFWVGMKNQGDQNYSIQMGRVEFQPDTSLAYTSVKRFSSMDYATSDGTDAGTLQRVAAATCGQYTVFRVALNDGAKVLYSIYDNTALNNLLDSSSAKNPVISGVKPLKSFTQTKGAAGYVAPNNSFQGIEISAYNSIYLSGGNGSAERPQIAMINSNGTYKSLIQLTNWGATNNPSIQGMQAKLGNLYFVIPEGSDRTNGQKIYYVPETAFGVEHTTFLTREGTRTCESAGLKPMYGFCDHCNCDQDVAEYYAAMGHAYVDVAAVAATCTTYGKTAGKVCSRCNKWSTLPTETAPTGHSYNAGVVTREPTCAMVGIRTFTCSKCSGSYTEEIEKLLHTDDNNDNICDVCACSTDAEPQNIILDYAKTIESNIVEKAIINGIPAEHIRKAKIESITAADSADSNSFSAAAFDGDGDGVADSLRLTLKEILQKVLRLNCKISFTGPDGASYERIIPVNIVPATSVYYETDTAGEMFDLTTTGSAWSVVGTPNTTNQDSGDTDEPVSDLAYNFQNIPSGAFYTDFNGGETRYARDYIYAGVNYDSQTNWSYDATRLSGYTVDSVLGTLTLTRKNAAYNSFWFQSGASSQSGYNLNYIPKDNHYAIIRVKFASAAFTESVNPKVDLRYYTASDKTEAGAYSDHTEFAGEAYFPAEYLTNGEYVTIKFKLNFNESYLRERVTAFRWGFSGLQDGQGSTSNSATIDYIYVGPLEGIEGVEGFENMADSDPHIAPEYYEAPAYGYNDYLLFDFDNSPQARTRYNNTAYKNFTNYDTATHWTSLYDNYSTDGRLQNVKREGKAVTVDNLKGTLTLNVAKQESSTGRFGSYLSVTNGTNQLLSFTDVGDDHTVYQCLNFKPKSNTSYYFHIRFKVTGCKKEDTVKYADGLSVQFSCINANSTSWQFKNSPTYRLEYNSDGTIVEKYVSLTTDVTTQVSACPNIVSLYFRFNNLIKSGSSNGKIEIDYIYIGPEKDSSKIRSPKQENVMIDFDNGDYDKNRYAGHLYGGVNFDSTGGWGNTYWYAPTFANSVMKLVPNQVALDHATGAGRISPLGDISALNYKMTGEDYIVIRMKTNNIGVKDASKGANFRLFFGEKDKVNYGEGSISETSMDLSGQWKDYVYDISSYAQKYDFIRYLFIEFYNLSYGTNPSIEIDFFYIGKLENGTRPAEALYFGFGDRLEDQTRYDSLTYGNLNFDKTANWYNRENAGSIAVDNDRGVLEVKPVAGTTYLAVDSTDASLSFPLSFHPQEVEVVQVRFKMENFTVHPSSDPFLRFQYFYDNKTDASTTGDHYFPAKYLSNGEYITMTIDLRDDPIREVAEIVRIRCLFGHFNSNANSKITIDYIYLGPGDLIDSIEMTYGYDESYASGLEFSNNSSYFVEGAGVVNAAYELDSNNNVMLDSNGDKITYINYASATNYTEASFAFTGKGFDIIGRTGPEQAALRVYVCDQDGYVKKTVSVINKGINNFYQIPVVSVDMEAHGTYTVHIFVNAAFKYEDPNGILGGALDRGGEFYFDAIRIYDTIDTTVDTADAKLAYALYQSHGEADATITEVRDMLITANNFDATGEMQGVVYLDAAAGSDASFDNQNGVLTPEVAEYRAIGPNNEVYLESGNAIAFIIEAKGAIPASIDIGVKRVTSDVPSMIIDVSRNALNVQTNGTETAVRNSTAQYYPIEIQPSQWVKVGDKTTACITICNSGDNGILSLTDIKYAYGEDTSAAQTAAEKGVRFLVNAQMLEAKEECRTHSFSYVDLGANHTVACEMCDFSATEEHAFADGACVCGARDKTIPVMNENLTITPSISVGAEMQVVYTIVGATVKNFDSFYVEVTKDVANGEPVTTTFSLSDGNLQALDSNGVVVGYNATYTGIVASQMGDNFSAKLCAVGTDGTIYYGPSVESSIKSYLLGKINDQAASAELKTLAVDMLNYGAAAQVHFGYDTENLVNADLSAEMLALGTQTKPEATDRTAIIGSGSKITTSVSLQSKVYLYLTCMYASNENSNLKFVIKDADGRILEELVPSAVYANACQLSYANVGAAQMRKILTIEVYDNDALVSQSLTWSVESYVASGRTNSASSEAMVNVLNAMLVYGDSAAAYIGTFGQ